MMDRCWMQGVCVKRAVLQIEKSPTLVPVFLCPSLFLSIALVLFDFYTEQVSKVLWQKEASSPHTLYRGCSERSRQN